MPGAYAELNDLLANQAEIQAAARQAAEAKLKEIHSHRHHVIRQKSLNGQNVEMPVAAPELLASYMRVNEYSYHRGPSRIGWFSPTGSPQQLRQVADVLGVAVPRPEAVAA